MAPRIDELSVGLKASVTKAFTEAEVVAFSQMSLDSNPIHLDDDFAQRSIFGERIVHGMLVASLFSGLLGRELPGEGTIYLGQELQFLSPVPLGEEVTATVEILFIREDKPIVTLKTTCINAVGTLIVKGEATVKVVG